MSLKILTSEVYLSLRNVFGHPHQRGSRDPGCFLKFSVSVELLSVLGFEYLILIFSYRDKPAAALGATFTFCDLNHLKFCSCTVMHCSAHLL